jgi:hypothetical protein
MGCIVTGFIIVGLISLEFIVFKCLSKKTQKKILNFIDEI